MRGKRKKRSNKTFFFLLHLQSSLLCHLFIYYLPQDLEELKSYDPWGKGFGTRKVGNERKERERLREREGGGELHLIIVKEISVKSK